VVRKFAKIQNLI
jgi:hypothetical protein